MAKNPNAARPVTCKWNDDVPKIKFKKMTFDRWVVPSPRNGNRTIRRTLAYTFVNPAVPNEIWAVCKHTKIQDTNTPETNNYWGCWHVGTGAQIQLARKIATRQEAAYLLWNYAGKVTPEKLQEVLREKMTARAAVILALPI
jgi:hypothetical protein